MANLVKFYPRALRNLSLSYSKSDLITVGLIALVVSIWGAIAEGSFSFLAFFACVLIFFSFYLSGSIFAEWTSLATNVLFDLPLRLLIGYGVINTSLLVLAWVSPLGMIANFTILLALTSLVYWNAKQRKQTSGNPTSLWAIGICLSATTLWCRDSINPIEEHERFTLFKPWIDGFYHAVHIRIFAESHGASTIEDFRMAGVPARLYHYGVYMMPAFIKQVSGLHSYSVFAGILAPVGVFFTGLGAYAFVGSLLGAWPAVAACAALLLLPDGAQQGMQNPFMSYQWLTQISPSATYGLALMAVAWLFVMVGCTRGNRLQLMFGWLVAALVVAYKLHYVVASALLLLLIPALFFRADLGSIKRSLCVAAALAFYVTALTLGQMVPGVPLIRFDGSAHGEILRLVQSFVRPGPLKEYLTEHMGAKLPWTANLLWGVPYVLITVLGLILPIFIILVVSLRRRIALPFLLFPLLLIVNFLTMFFGLALDFSSSTPDELSHRPLMLVYFFVVAWVGGALGFLFINAQRSSSWARPGIVGLSLVLLSVPAYFGPGVQLMWVMSKVSPARVPISLVRVAEYLRTHSSRADIFQDSQFDRTYTIAALSERRTFVAHTMTHMPFREELVSTRTVAINRVMAMSQPKLVASTLKVFHVRWFIVPLGNRLNWPGEMVNNPVLKEGPISLYEFP